MKTISVVSFIALIAFAYLADEWPLLKRWWLVECYKSRIEYESAFWKERLGSIKNYWRS